MTSQHLAGPWQRQGRGLGPLASPRQASGRCLGAPREKLQMPPGKLPRSDKEWAASRRMSGSVWADARTRERSAAIRDTPDGGRQTLPDVCADGWQASDRPVEAGLALPRCVVPERRHRAQAQQDGGPTGADLHTAPASPLPQAVSYRDSSSSSARASSKANASRWRESSEAFVPPSA